MAAWSRKTLKCLTSRPHQRQCRRFWRHCRWCGRGFRNLCVFWKTTSCGKIFKIPFRKFSLSHRLTFLCLKVVKFVRRKIGEIVRYLPDKPNINSPASQTVATARIAPIICQGQPPTMYSESFRFRPNRFTFGGVIAERINTAKLPRRVNIILEPNNNYHHLHCRVHCIVVTYIHTHKISLSVR